MKKAAIGILSLVLLTGCWDRLPLRNLHLVDIAGIDLEEKSGEVIVDYIVTKLKSAGQGEGEPVSVMTELKGPSLVEAVGQGEYVDQTPFLGVNTRIYFMSKRFASNNPVPKLAFLLNAPYSTINAPVVVFDGSMTKFLKTKSGPNQEFTKNLNEFVLTMDKTGTMPDVSIMRFILSREEPLEDIALPVFKPFNSGMELGGALLFRHGKSTGKELEKEQVQMLMLMSKKNLGRQRITGSLSVKGKHIDYGFSVKTRKTKIIVHPVSGGLPKVNIAVRMRINVFEIGEAAHKLKPDYVNRMEKELSKHFNEEAAATIKNLQKANCDVLGIGKQLKAYYPDTWKSLKWRKDYPQLQLNRNSTCRSLTLIHHRLGGHVQSMLLISQLEIQPITYLLIKLSDLQGSIFSCKAKATLQKRRSLFCKIIFPKNIPLKILFSPSFHQTLLNFKLSSNERRRKGMNRKKVIIWSAIITSVIIVINLIHEILGGYQYGVHTWGPAGMGQAGGFGPHGGFGGHHQFMNGPHQDGGFPWLVVFIGIAVLVLLVRWFRKKAKTSSMNTFIDCALQSSQIPVMSENARILDQWEKEINNKKENE